MPKSRPSNNNACSVSYAANTQYIRTYTLTMSDWSKPVDVNVVTQLLTTSSQHRRVLDRPLGQLVLLVLCLKFIILQTSIILGTVCV